MTDDDRRIHPSPFPDWHATQDASCRGVWLCDKTSDRKILVEPPAEWGRHWSWNVTEDGRGIYIRQERQFAPEAKVFSRLDGEPGTILNWVSPDEYEVMTDHGIEKWRDEDIQAVEED